jgi:hypothetical protein
MPSQIRKAVVPSEVHGKIGSGKEVQEAHHVCR